MNAQPAYTCNNTNLGVFEVIGYDTLSTSRGLSKTGVTEADLLEQESIATEYRRGTLRARVRRDRISLEGAVASDKWMI